MKENNLANTRLTILENIPNTRSQIRRMENDELNRQPKAVLDGYCQRRFFTYTLADFTVSSHENVSFFRGLRYLRGAKSRPHPLAQTTRTA